MAVVVQCYHCSNILELDEGFRGGVCRCSQCGSLLQVPKSSASSQPIERPASPGSGLRRPASPREGDAGISRGQFDPRSGIRSAQPGSGAFSRGPTRPAAPVRPAAPGQEASGNGGNDLAALAEAALHQGSGISHVKRQAEGGEDPYVAQEKAVHKSNALLYAGLAAIGVLVIIAAVLGFIMVGSAKRQAPRPPEGTAATAGGAGGVGGEVKPGVQGAGGPAFLTVPLVGDHIIFSLDAGSSAQESLDYVRVVVENIAPKLAADQKFKVVLWQEKGLKSLPESGWLTRSELEKIREPFENIGAWGRTEPVDSMKATLKLAEGSRAQVIFVSAKADLPGEQAAPVLEARGATRIDTVRIAGTSETATSQNLLELLATRGGGRYVSLDAKQLENMALQSGRP